MESEKTSKLSREHAVAVPVPGVVAIAGGKFTTYRVMAADAIDATSEYVPARVAVAPSTTEKVPMMGQRLFALINQTEHVGAVYGPASLPRGPPAGPLRLADRGEAGDGRQGCTGG